MREDSELEEGELNCSTNQAVVDLDVDLSYIDKKVENVLGHLQKDFGEGALELFGSKIYDYGSFLRTDTHLPAVPSCQRSSLGNHAEQRFSNNLPGKNVVQKFQPLPTTFQSLPTTSCKLVASNQDPQNCQPSGSLLAQAPEKVPIKKGNARIPGNGFSHQKPIKVRIKMGTELLSQKVTMVYNDLGLNDSPDSPPQSSHDDSSRMLPHTSLEKTSESPSHILQEMTAIPVPEDLLMSPLPHFLILVKDKEKKYTLLENQPVLKAGKEPSIETHNKFSEVLGCEETLSGRRRKAVDCFGASTWNETSLVGKMKKQKVLSTSLLAREKSTCGVGGESSTNDGLKTKNNLQKGMKKDGESDPRVAFAKSNKTKLVGKHAEKEKNTCPTKLKQNSSKNRFGDKFLSKMPFKDTTYVGQTSMDTGVDFAVAPSSTILDLDTWAQCENCKTWRLLPSGLKPEQLPDKWLCSMQSWLPGMNHCGISEEETINAIKSFHASEAHGLETGVKLLSDASNADKSYQPLTCGSLPCPIEKKSDVKEFSQGVSTNILGDTAKPMKSNSYVFKIKNMKLPIETPNATQMSTKLGVSHTFVQDNVDRKANSLSAGTGSQIKIKKKKEGDKQESDGSMHIKTGDGNKLARDIKAEEIHWNQDLEWTPAERKTKRHDKDFYTLDVEQNTKKRLLASKKKPDDKPQLTSGSGSLCTKAHGKISSPVRKLRLMGYKQSQNGSNLKSYADGEEKEPSVEKAITTKISVQESEAHQRNELFQADGSQEHWNADASCRYFSGGSGQISGVETSSSSKIFGSHKSGRMCGEEVKASPVESVSSSPARSSCPKNLPSAGESIAWKNQNLKYGDDGSRAGNNGIPLSQEADCEILSTTHSGNRKQLKPEVCKQNSEFGDLPCTSRKMVLENRAGVKNFGASTHETMDRSCQAANDILQEAEKLRKVAECFKSSGFDYKYKKTTFKAALRFLRGASLLEKCSTENVEGGKMSHVEAYHTAAKLSESCAHQYETSQEMAAAALAFKCTEVACMRVVYGRSLALSGELKELQKMVHMTPQGESPSSSASDVDSFNHQGVIDKSAKTKRGLSHVAGNLLPVARSQLNCFPLVDFTESMNLAMAASAKSQNAFKAASVTSEETKHGDCISAIKKVIDFSFHDVEALIQMIEAAMSALSSSRIGGPKC
ncbi:Cysteine-tryptophan domain-containing zinc finger protein 3 [Cardamine amara subsp. amara]|uniref:Cysteine-tryptophan domain-containing zinc finger protein 3 n=1 Tax=Cardamine amara subsp. amara TaxID=228776 RepID=A0ABD1BTN3_CARAN